MERKKSFWEGLLSAIGMMVGLFVFYFLICLGYYNWHVRYQKLMRGNVDDGAAAGWSQRLFGIWAVLFVISAYFFNEFNWYETHESITDLVIKCHIGFLLVGVFGLFMSMED
jgi:O-antigen ligase